LLNASYAVWSLLNKHYTAVFELAWKKSHGFALHIY